MSSDIKIIIEITKIKIKAIEEIDQKSTTKTIKRVGREIKKEIEEEAITITREDIEKVKRQFNLA